MNYNSVIRTVMILVSDLLGFELDHLNNNGNTVAKKQLLLSLISRGYHRMCFRRSSGSAMTVGFLQKVED